MNSLPVAFYGVGSLAAGSEAFRVGLLAAGRITCCCVGLLAVFSLFSKLRRSLEGPLEHYIAQNWYKTSTIYGSTSSSSQPYCVCNYLHNHEIGLQLLCHGDFCVQEYSIVMD